MKRVDKDYLNKPEPPECSCGETADIKSHGHWFCSECYKENQADRADSILEERRRKCVR